ncbi:phage terminase small subunit [Neobacillus sp. M.A.Huq-85]
MAADHIKAEKDYVKGLKYKEIAEMHGVSINTVKSWKQRYGWVRNKGAPSGKSVHTKKRGAPKGNINAKGNSGGAAPKGNQNAKTHGLFSKFLPPETLEIMESLNDRSPADLIWDQIQIQYAAIIRAQQIMFVRDQDAISKEIKKEKSVRSDNMDVDETEWEIQFAWDKHATFLNAQSRAMSELRSLIRQFDEMAHIDDERRLKLEGMKLGIEKTKKEVDKLNSGNDDKPIEILIKRKSERS